MSLVTIIIPTYKRDNLLFQSIKSVYLQKKSNFIDLLILDNDSERLDRKKIPDYINKLSLNLDVKINYMYIINEKNIGMFGNWNKGIDLTKTKYFSILNDDDILDPNWGEEFYYHEKESSKIFLTRNKKFYGNNYIEITNDKVPTSIKCNINKYDFFYGNINHGSLGMVFPKTDLRFDPKMGFSSDFDFNYKNFIEFGCVRYENITSFYRISENESLNKNTLISFLVNDHDFRMKYFCNKNLSNIFIKYCSKYLNYSNFSIYKETYNSKLNVSDLPRGFFNKYNSTLLFRFYMFFIRKGFFN